MMMMTKNLMIILLDSDHELQLLRTGRSHCSREARMDIMPTLRRERVLVL